MDETVDEAADEAVVEAEDEATDEATDEAVDEEETEEVEPEEGGDGCTYQVMEGASTSLKLFKEPSRRGDLRGDVTWETC